MLQRRIFSLLNKHYFKHIFKFNNLKKLILHICYIIEKEVRCQIIAWSSLLTY